MKAIWVYLTVFGTLLAAGLGVPIPEELPIIGAGTTVGAANPELGLRWWIMLPVCIVGVVIGDAFLYTIGRVWGQRLLHNRWVQRKVLPPERRARFERLSHRYGIWILLIARMLPGIRSPIFITAGINRLPVAKFLIADGIYAIFGVSLLFTLSYWFGDQAVEIFDKAQKARAIVVVCVIAAVGAALVYYFVKHPVSTGDPEDVPIIGHQLASHMQNPDANELPTDEKPSGKKEGPINGDPPPSAGQ